MYRLPILVSSESFCTAFLLSVGYSFTFYRLYFCLFFVDDIKRNMICRLFSYVSPKSLKNQLINAPLELCIAMFDVRTLFYLKKSTEFSCFYETCSKAKVKTLRHLKTPTRYLLYFFYSVGAPYKPYIVASSIFYLFLTTPYHDFNACVNSHMTGNTGKRNSQQQAFPVCVLGAP